ncbi:MAG: hypothetical protein K0R90_381 [Oscillospiraceae bacterium]|jgi:fluoroquinolone transport system permease protein|nr:hypothetical protein [Oscillospiraceae bacterium]
MKPVLLSFKMFISQILKDRMLIAVLFAPILTACFFRYAIPQAETILCRYSERVSILSDYYLLFDLFLSMITSYMFCFASSMVMLTEYDETMISYLAVTPVGKKGYILSRMILPAAISFIVSIILMRLFSLTDWSLIRILLICFLTCLLSVAVSLLLFAYSHNKVEGMAMAKLSGLLMLGLPVPFFLGSNLQYLFLFLPSFWIGKFSRENTVLFFVFALVTALIWLWILFRSFERKIL